MTEDEPLPLEPPSPFPSQPGFYVFADRTTGAIRGWVSMRARDLEHQVVGANEMVLEVDRQPNPMVDKYIDLTTGEMRGEA